MRSLTLMNRHEYYMNRALDLASLGKGNVAPNPMVGAVLVYKDRIIGEGFHTAHSQPHAEAEAIQRVKEQALLPYATLYVNLEPCSHHGKTPPCSDLIVHHQIPEVVIACHDDNAEVSGQGIQKLQQAGIKVTTGVLEVKARFLNRRFFTFHQKQRPYIILKWAQTSDGFLADINGQSQWISNPFSRQYVHKWRAEEGAIMVGTQTALNDHPRLTARDWKGANPLRIFLDKNLQLDPRTHAYDQATPTWILNEQKEEMQGNLAFVKMDFQAEWLKQLCRQLWEQGIASLIVEGGGQLLNSFVQEQLWDEARVFTNPQKSFIEGIAAPKLPVKKGFTTWSGGDMLSYFYKNKTSNS